LVEIPGPDLHRGVQALQRRHRWASHSAGVPGCGNAGKSSYAQDHLWLASREAWPVVLQSRVLSKFTKLGLWNAALATTTAGLVARQTRRLTFSYAFPLFQLLGPSGGDVPSVLNVASSIVDLEKTHPLLPTAATVENSPPPVLLAVSMWGTGYRDTPA
jgi:hypothetical protein